MLHSFKKYPIIFLVMLYCFSCTKTDNKPSVTVTSNGLKLESIILKLNNDTLTSSEIDFDKDLILNIFGLQGFNETVGNIFLGCDLLLTDEAGKEILKYKDLYSYYEVSGISAIDVKKKFSISLSIQEPLKKGGTYIWKSKIWDKKGKGDMNTEIKFKIKNDVK